MQKLDEINAFLKCHGHFVEIGVDGVSPNFKRMRLLEIDYNDHELSFQIKVQPLSANERPIHYSNIGTYARSGYPDGIELWQKVLINPMGDKIVFTDHGVCYQIRTGLNLDCIDVSMP